MTANHIIFIPIIFLIGLILGGLLSSFILSNKQQTVKPTIANSSVVKATPLIISFIFFALVFVATHTLSIPYGVNNIEELSGGEALFDKSPLFSHVEVYHRLETFGANARDAYKVFLFTTDLIFPISFLLLLSLYATYVSKKVHISKKLSRFLSVVPLVWFSLDMVENSIIYAMLEQFPRPTVMIANVLAYITVSKFVMLFVALVLPIATGKVQLEKRRKHTQFG